MSIKLIWVVGARPNLMKAAPILKALKAYNGRQESPSRKFHFLLVHTGQHYDENLSDVFFNDLGLPTPEYSLGVGSGSHAIQTAKILIEFEKILYAEKPEAIGLVGDVNSTLACALAAAKCYLHNPNGQIYRPVIIHVEAGLRSGDRMMPEEINRILTDAISDLLFVTERSALENLIREGVLRDRTHFVGNVMVDSLSAVIARPRGSGLRERLGLENSGHKYCLVTLHRPSNVDDPEQLNRILETLLIISRDLKVIFPVHPRTEGKIREYGFKSTFLPDAPLRSSLDNKGVILLPPLGYADFVDLMVQAHLVITDSGGIQEETTALGIPCLTLRENTERPITVTEGTNQLVGRDMTLLRCKVAEILRGDTKTGRRPKLWDGHAAERIVKILSEKLISRKEISEGNYS